jgi:addiction module RelE/StbE family toxin
MYEISYSKPAERYLKKIKDKQLLRAFKEAIDELKENPYVGSQKTGDLRGIYSYDVKYNDVNYELAYRIYEEENQFVVVILAGTRENFYEELKRLIKY